MLTNLFLLLKMSARRVKTAESTFKKPSYEGKMKFTEEELTKMGDPTLKNKPSIFDTFKDKTKSTEEQEKQKTTRYEKKIKQNKQKLFYNRPLYKHLDHENRIQVEDMSLQELASVRLGPQFLPPNYLRQAQKIFHKYSQQHLREIAGYFSKMLRLRYTQEKIDYEKYEDLGFARLEEKLPKQKQVEQIYLIGEQKIYEDREYSDKRKSDDDPLNTQLSYTQNIAVSYLLNRVPRTFAAAIRMFTQIKYKYPKFNPDSFLDFGSGLSSGSCAFLDIFPKATSVYNIQPAGKMRKLSKFLTEDFSIKHFQTLGQCSHSVREVDIVYAGYVLNELKPELVEVYLEALYAKVKNNGFLIVVEYGSPFGARLVHEVRKWAIEKKMYIAAPCPHHGKCPLAKEKSWCHFDQPSGMYPKNIFGSLPTDQAVRLQKYSYLILQKVQKEENQNISSEKQEPNVTKDWDRVIFPVMKRGRHTVLNLCTKLGRFQRRISAKSHGPEYKEVKKLKWGDYWRFGKRIPNRYRKERQTGKRLW